MVIDSSVSCDLDTNAKTLTVESATTRSDSSAPRVSVVVIVTQTIDDASCVGLCTNIHTHTHRYDVRMCVQSTIHTRTRASFTVEGARYCVPMNDINVDTNRLSRSIVKPWITARD